MEKLPFKLEFITPAFIGGANHQAELRPASFIGLLRWWWRALRAEDNLKILKKEEAEIFGLEDKAGGFFLRIRGDVYTGNNLRDDLHLDCHYDGRTRSVRGRDEGLCYLLYSAFLPNKERSYIKAGSTFELTLLGKKDYLKPLLASLWALVFLGGVGLRSRRGGGSLAVIEAKGNRLCSLDFNPVGDVEAWYRENLKKAFECVNSKCVSGPEYSNLLGSDILISKAKFKDWREALNDIGVKFKRFREQNKKHVFEMGAFGMPIRHSNNQFLKPERHQRRASPLIIKLIKVENSYRWVLVKLRGNLLPRGEKLVLGKNKSDPSYELLEKFLNTLKQDSYHLVGGCNV